MTPREKKKAAVTYATQEMQRFAKSVGQLIERYAEANDIDGVIQASSSLAKDLREMKKATNEMIKSPVEDLHAYPEPIQLDFTETKPVPKYPDGWIDGPAMVGERGKEIVRELPGGYQTDPIHEMRHEPIFPPATQIVINQGGRAGGKTLSFMADFIEKAELHLTDKEGRTFKINRDTGKIEPVLVDVVLTNTTFKRKSHES